MTYPDLAMVIPVWFGEVVPEDIIRDRLLRTLTRISHHPLGGWIIGCELECFFLSVAFAVEPGPVGGWS